MKKLLTLFVLNIVTSVSFAGNDNLPGTSRTAAMGGCGTALHDIWSAANNQAGLAFLENINLGIYNEQRFLLQELGNRGFIAAMPVKNVGVFAVHYNQFGYSLYRETKTAVSYSRTFGENFAAAMQLDYLSTRIGEGYGNNSTFAVEAGVIAKLTPELNIGAHIYNPGRNSLAEYEDERIPTIVKLGFAYSLSEKLLLTLDSEKDIDEDNIIRAGIEYMVVDQLYLRGGVASNPTYGAFGVGWNISDFQIDIAAGFHQTLGVSPSLSISYKIK